MPQTWRRPLQVAIGPTMPARGVQIDDEIVLRLSAESPIYRSAARYFDYLYELDGAEADQLSILETKDQKSFDIRCRPDWSSPVRSAVSNRCY